MKIVLFKKKNIYKQGLIVFLFLISFNSFSQIKFGINEESKWRYFKNYWSGQSGHFNKVLYEYNVIGDTLINTQVYKTIFMNSKHTHIISHPEYSTYINYYENEYIGSIRGFNDSFFFVFKDSINEVELYNFNLGIGDTINTLIHNGAVITDVDTLSNGRRCLRFVNPNILWDSFIIEGIGSNIDLFSTITYSVGCDVITKFICYSENDTIVYEESNWCGYNCYDNISQINSYNHISENTEIFPNPANDILNIEISKKATLEIINIQGQVVETKGLTIKSNSLDLSNLVRGVYTLRIKTDSGIEMKKLIKQ